MFIARFFFGDMAGVDRREQRPKSLSPKRIVTAMDLPVIQAPIDRKHTRDSSRSLSRYERKESAVKHSVEESQQLIQVRAAFKQFKKDKKSRSSFFKMMSRELGIH